MEKVNLFNRFFSLQGEKTHSIFWETRIREEKITEKKRIIKKWKKNFFSSKKVNLGMYSFCTGITHIEGASFPQAHTHARTDRKKTHKHTHTHTHT